MRNNEGPTQHNGRMMKRKGRGGSTNPKSQRGLHGLDRQDYYDNDIRDLGVYANQSFMRRITSNIGYPVKVETTMGVQYEGIFTTFSRDFEIVLELAHRVNPSSPDSLHPDNVQDLFVLNVKDLVRVTFENVDLEKDEEDIEPPMSSFRTDRGISKFNGEVSMEKELEPWEDSSSVCNGDEFLGDANNKDGWDVQDMFRTNESTYGVQSTYDDTLAGYTMELETEDTPDFKETEAKAARIAEEIEKNISSQARLAMENGDDEEELFAAVKREDSGESEGGAESNRGGKYIMPAKRARHGYISKSGGHHRGGSVSSLDSNYASGSGPQSSNYSYSYSGSSKPPYGSTTSQTSSRHSVSSNSSSGLPPRRESRSSAHPSDSQGKHSRGQPPSGRGARGQGRQQQPPQMGNAPSSSGRYHSQQQHWNLPNQQQQQQSNNAYAFRENRSAEKLPTDSPRSETSSHSYSMAPTPASYSHATAAASSLNRGTVSPSNSSNNIQGSNTSLHSKSPRQFSSSTSVSSLSPTETTTTTQVKRSTPRPSPSPSKQHIPAMQMVSSTSKPPSQPPPSLPESSQTSDKQHPAENCQQQQQVPVRSKGSQQPQTQPSQPQIQQQQVPLPQRKSHHVSQHSNISKGGNEKSLDDLKKFGTEFNLANNNSKQRPPASSSVSTSRETSPQETVEDTSSPRERVEYTQLAPPQHPQSQPQLQLQQPPQPSVVHQKPEAIVSTQHYQMTPSGPILVNIQQPLPPSMQQQQQFVQPQVQHQSGRQSSQFPPIQYHQVQQQPPPEYVQMEHMQQQQQQVILLKQQSQDQQQQQIPVHRQTHQQHSSPPQQQQAEVSTPLMSPQTAPASLPPQNASLLYSSSQPPPVQVKDAPEKAGSEDRSSANGEDNMENTLDKVTSTLKKSNLNPNAKEFIYNPKSTFSQHTSSTPSESRSHSPPAPSYAAAPSLATTATAAPGVVVLPAASFMVPQYIAAAPPTTQNRIRKGMHRTEYHPSNMQVAAATGQPLLAPAVTLAQSSLTPGQFTVQGYAPHAHLAAAAAGQPFPQVQMVRLLSQQNGSVVPLVPSTLSYHDASGNTTAAAAATAIYNSQAMAAAATMSPHLTHLHHHHHHQQQQQAQQQQQSPSQPQQQQVITPSTAPSPSHTPQAHSANSYQSQVAAAPNAASYQPIVCPVIQTAPPHGAPHHMIAPTQPHTTAMPQYVQHSSMSQQHMQVLLPHANQ